MEKTEKPYNSLFGPGAQWLSLAEEERIERVLRYHETLRLPHPPTPKPRVHAAMHVLVENQLAAREPLFVTATMERLLAGGLNRHEAVHAIAQVAADLVMAAGLGRKYDAKTHEEALALLDPSKLRGEAANDET